MIRSGTVNEVRKQGREWFIIDLGFAQKSRSCGLLVGNGDPEELRFSELIQKLLHLIESGRGPMNILLEAPLSVAFDAYGNPTGRAIEKRGPKSRYWYVGLGCAVLVAATYTLRAISDLQSTREILLYEGFASFKMKGAKSSHRQDVLALRSIVRDLDSRIGKVVAPEFLKRQDTDVLQSAFKVSGMDFGIPPVVIVGG